MDLRIEHIFREEMKGDKSFQEKESGLSLLFGTNKYSKVEMRETWDRGIKHGIEIGLRKASLEGQRIELNHNTPEGKHKETWPMNAPNEDRKQTGNMELPQTQAAACGSECACHASGAPGRIRWIKIGRAHV